MAVHSHLDQCQQQRSKILIVRGIQENVGIFCKSW